MPEATERRSVRIGSPWTGASAWARMMTDGRLELELYDHSQEAEQSMGGDVAWIYVVEPAEIPRLLDLLGLQDETALLEAFARRFPHVHAVRDWLQRQQIPYTEQFDSQA